MSRVLHMFLFFHLELRSTEFKQAASAEFTAKQLTRLFPPFPFLFLFLAYSNVPCQCTAFAPLSSVSSSCIFYVTGEAARYPDAFYYLFSFRAVHSGLEPVYMSNNSKA
ncbi:hypothetical protein BDV18DRAFT_132270 [Aspergillus unguis]